MTNLIVLINAPVSKSNGWGGSTQRQLLIELVSRSTTANGHALSKMLSLLAYNLFSFPCWSLVLHCPVFQAVRPPAVNLPQSVWRGTDARFINSSGRHDASKTTVVSDTAHDGASSSTTPDCETEQYDQLYITDLHFQSNKHDQFRAVILQYQNKKQDALQSRREHFNFIIL
jgi:hypothetical protein